MDLETFKTSLEEEQPSQKFSGPLKALWHAGRGAWGVAHEIVQDDVSRDAAWVHAYLHRVEGDLSNAAYWYSKAGKPVEKGDLEREWEAVVSTLLSVP